MDPDTFWTAILISSALFSAVVAWTAAQKNRNPWSWFFISLAISPLVSLLVLIAIGPGKGAKASTEGADLSNLSDEEVATLQAHRARQTASRVALPKKLDQ